MGKAGQKAMPPAWDLNVQSSPDPETDLSAGMYGWIQGEAATTMACRLHADPCRAVIWSIASASTTRISLWPPCRMKAASRGIMNFIAWYREGIANGT